MIYQADSTSYFYGKSSGEGTRKFAKYPELCYKIIALFSADICKFPAPFSKSDALKAQLFSPAFPAPMEI